MPADAVAESIVDVALGKAKPALALNLRHPQPVAWHTLIDSCARALHDSGVTHKLLPLVDLHTWVEKVRAASNGANDDTLKQIVGPPTLRPTRWLIDALHQPAIKLLDFFCGMSEADSATRKTAALDCQASEVGGLATLAVEKAQAASAAFRDMHVLGERDATRWVAYWKTRGFLDT
jgi:hypothetical protein